VSVRKIAAKENGMTISEHARRRFERAVVDLARTQPADRITLRAICARAGMGRHSFYQVFGSLEDAKGAVSQQVDAVGSVRRRV